ncbi:hypothetical protein ACVIIV_003385 [Bradyrhizobium sp. USDA 4354]
MPDVERQQDLQPFRSHALLAAVSREYQSRAPVMQSRFDKLSHYSKHLEFAEDRGASGSKRVSHVRTLRESLAFSTIKREQADQLPANLENLKASWKLFAFRLHERGHSCSI